MRRVPEWERDVKENDMKTETREKVGAMPKTWRIGAPGRFHDKHYIPITEEVPLRGGGTITLDVAWASKEDAPLLAAAPALLAACRMVYQNILSIGSPKSRGLLPDEVEQIRLALRQAEGGTK